MKPRQNPFCVIEELGGDVQKSGKTGSLEKKKQSMVRSIYSCCAVKRVSKSFVERQKKPFSIYGGQLQEF